MASRDLWTDEKTQGLKDLWKRGFSASQVADRLGGVSRSSVLGKVHRLGLAKRSHPNNAEKTARKARRSRPTPVASPVVAPKTHVRAAVNTAPLPSDPAPHERVQTLLLLKPRHCRWPFGHVGEPGFGFCGRRRRTGSAYCDAHWRRSISRIVRAEAAE